MGIDVADAAATAFAVAVAEGIVPHGNSSSSTARYIIDCIKLSCIVLDSVKPYRTAFGYHSTCQ